MARSLGTDLGELTQCLQLLLLGLHQSAGVSVEVESSPGQVNVLQVGRDVSLGGPLQTLPQLGDLLRPRDLVGFERVDHLPLELREVFILCSSKARELNITRLGLGKRVETASLVFVLDVRDDSLQRSLENLDSSLTTCETLLREIIGPDSLLQVAKKVVDLSHPLLPLLDLVHTMFNFMVVSSSIVWDSLDLLGESLHVLGDLGSVNLYCDLRLSE